MSDAPPLIGITAGNDPAVPQHYILRWDYIHGVTAAGAIPVILAPLEGIDQRDILNRLDGLILTGGLDIDPVVYGQTPHPKTHAVTLQRDEFEMNLVKLALNNDIPLLGICRGMQMMNLAMGGSMLQDIPDIIGPDIKHDDPKRPRDALAHTVKILNGSLLHQITQADELMVNSFHHQAVSELGEGVRMTAQALDGVIEAIEIPAKQFAVGVQWHPESLWSKQQAFMAFFNALISAAKNNAKETNN